MLNNKNHTNLQTHHRVDDVYVLSSLHARVNGGLFSFFCAVLYICNCDYCSYRDVMIRCSVVKDESVCGMEC